MHWIDLAVEYGVRADADAWLRRLALGYPDLVGEDEVAVAETLDLRVPLYQERLTTRQGMMVPR